MLLILAKLAISIWKKKRLVDKAVVSMYEILKLGRKHNLSIQCQLSLFDKMIKPILFYGCEIWGFGNNDVLEKVHVYSELYDTWRIRQISGRNRH